MDESKIIPLDVVQKLFHESIRPTLRFIREDMVKRGYTKKHGRHWVTTSSMANSYFEEITGEAEWKMTKQQKSDPISNHTGEKGKKSGLREAMSLSEMPMVRSPQDDLNSALRLKQKLKRSKNVTVSTKTM